MSWPLPHEFNEAVQSPGGAFADADLKAGDAVCGPIGLPLPRSGNFADVYQIRGTDGRDWAVKCFTRSVTGLDHRYGKVTQALVDARLPFTIPFAYLAEGINVGGRWVPIVKMEWVDGLQLNQFVRDNASKPAMLDALFVLWVRVCKRLREAGLAHADLQHGNVLLVPGAKPGQVSVKLIDYDGMYVPALANVPSGELGHSAYQHPARIAARNYSPDLDRFPHLVIATAIKALSIHPELWDKYDTGDNILFVEGDFLRPSVSKLMRELWNTNNQTIQALVGRLAVACSKPIPQTPWLDAIAPEGNVLPLTPEDTQAALKALGLAPKLSARVLVPPPPAAPVATPESAFAFDDPNDVSGGVIRPKNPSGVTKTKSGELKNEEPTAKKKTGSRSQPVVEEKAKKSPLIPILVGIAALFMLGGCALGAFLIFGRSKQPDSANISPDDSATNPTTRNKPTASAKPTTETIPTAVAQPVLTLPTTPATNPSPPVPIEIKPPPVEPVIPPPPMPVANEKVLTPKWEAKIDRGLGNASFTFQPDGTVSIIGKGGGTWIYTFDPQGKQLFKPVNVEKEGQLRGKPTLLDRNVLAAHADNGPVFRIFTPASGEFEPALDCAPITAGDSPERKRYLFLSPNGQFVFGLVPQIEGAGALEGNMRLYDLTAKKMIAEAPLNRILGMYAFSADSSRFMVFDKAGTLRTYALPGGQLTQVKIGEREKFNNNGHIAADGSKLIVFHSGDAKNPANGGLYDANTGKLLLQFSRDYHLGQSRIALSGKGLAMVKHDFQDNKSPYEVEVYDESCLNPIGIAKITPPTSDLPEVDFSPDGRRLAVYSKANKNLAVYEFGSAVAVGPSPVKPAGDLRLPVPDEEKLKETIAVIRELYKIDYARKTPADKKYLAGLLIKVGGDSKDAAEKYALFLEAKDLYAEAGAVKEVFEAIVLLASKFRFDATAMKTSALEKMTPLIPAANIKDLFDAALAQYDAEFAKDNFADALKIAQATLPVAKKSAVASNTAEVEHRIDLAKKADAAFAEMRPHVETLKEKPDDPDANLALGKYRCLQQCRWDDGLPLLTKGSDDALKAAAELDIAMAKAAVIDGKVADGWWEFGQKATGTVKYAYECRARYWYGRMAEKLIGLDKTKAEAKLAIAVNKILYTPGLSATFTVKTVGAASKLAARIDTVLNFATKEWVDTTKAKVDFTGKWVGAIFPPAPGRYKITAATASPVKVTINGVVLIDTIGTKKTATTAAVLLTEKPNPIVVEGTFTSDDGRSLALQWQKTGAAAPETIPAAYLYHSTAK
jgi:hypothetical protein